ncbi:hypothetical protein [Sphingomonas aquatilis]|uniref:Uncharacterized protein n=1 Tax=Sphingomonas aquatilis TaxID=93063 RepID=A0AAW3TS63_9SPHN|nr:hypothetical protein [Sphingomonas aquatilis]MBB3876508.1 hypothetical protein [Sphingomonas aquatilis]
MANTSERSPQNQWHALVLCCLCGLIVFSALLGYLAASRYATPAPSAGNPIDSALHQTCQVTKSRIPGEICAQWIAAHAANQSERWALGSLIVAPIGMIGTLFYARKTARIAADATIDTERALSLAKRNAESAERQVAITAEQTLRQLRAYVGIKAAMYHIAPHTHDGGASYGASIDFRNFGSTPAIDFRSNILINVLPYPITNCPAVGQMEGLTKILHPTMKTSSTISLSITPTAWSNIRAGTHCFFLTVAVEYVDHAGNTRTELTRFVTSADGPRGLPLNAATPLTFHSGEVDISW